MNRARAMLIIGLVFGGGLGFVLAAANGVTLDGHDHATDHATDHGADHGAAETGGDHAAHHDMPIVLSADEAPTLNVEIFPDPVSGWNLNIQTTDFTFSPESAGLEHVVGEGHAHVYANGVKLGRVYGDWIHLALPEGEVEVMVTLNANDHSPLAVGDTPIQASVTVNSASGG